MWRWFIVVGIISLILALITWIFSKEFNDLILILLIFGYSFIVFGIGAWLIDIAPTDKEFAATNPFAYGRYF